MQNNALAAELSETSVAWGNAPLANPDPVAGITHYGYITSGGGPLTQDPKGACKTEPDKNEYLVWAATATCSRATKAALGDT